MAVAVRRDFDAGDLFDLMAGLMFRRGIEVLSAAPAARRRFWSDADKLRIVEENFPGRRRAVWCVALFVDDMAAAVSARRAWRRDFRRVHSVDALARDARLHAGDLSDGAGRSSDDRLEIVLRAERRLGAEGFGPASTRAGATMIAFAGGGRVWTAGGVADMRRGVNTLAPQVQQGLGRGPHAGEIFRFRGRRGDLVKPLCRDGVGISFSTRDRVP